MSFNAYKKHKENEEKKLTAYGAALTARRRDTAEQVAEQIETALRDMEMKDARFHIQIDEKADWSADGKDKVEFLISANAGESLKPLAKIASGGELSRIMLAIKSVLTDKDDVETLIFDEVDTGISGHAATKVARRLKMIAESRQVICVTHLAQIAAYAEKQLLIKKESRESKTFTTVVSLGYEERIKELARIMSGADITENLYNSAKELLDRSKK